MLWRASVPCWPRRLTSTAGRHGACHERGRLARSMDQRLEIRDWDALAISNLQSLILAVPAGIGRVDLFGAGGRVRVAADAGEVLLGQGLRVGQLARQILALQPPV